MACGALTQFGVITDWTMNIDGTSIELPLDGGEIYVILIAIVGGLAMVIHSIATFNFKRKKITGDKSSMDDKEKASAELKGLTPPSAIVPITGFLTVLTSAYLIVENFMIVGDVVKNVENYMGYLIESLVIVLPLTMTPIYLASRNLSLNNDLNEKEAKKAASEKRKAVQAKKRRMATATPR